MNIINAIEKALEVSRADVNNIEEVNATRMEPAWLYKKSGWSVSYSTKGILTLGSGLNRVEVTDSGEAEVSDMS